MHHFLFNFEQPYGEENLSTYSHEKSQIFNGENCFGKIVWRLMGTWKSFASAEGQGYNKGQSPGPFIHL